MVIYVASMFGAEWWEDMAGALIYGLSPILASLLLLYFNPMRYVSSGPGHLIAFDMFGGVQPNWDKKWWLPSFFRQGFYLLPGEHAAYRMFNYYQIALGGNTVDVKPPGTFYVKGTGKDLVQVTNKDGGPPDITGSLLPLDLFKLIRRFAQGKDDTAGNLLLYNDLQDTSSSLMRLAVTDLKLRDVMGSPDLDQKLSEAFSKVEGDQASEIRLLWVKISGHKERVVDTECGLGLYNIHINDLSPNPELAASLRKKSSMNAEVDAKKGRLDVAVKYFAKLGLTGDNLVEAAMTLTGDLDGDEIRRQRISLSLGGSKDLGTIAKELKDLGYQPGDIEKIVGHLAKAAGAFGPAATASAIGEQVQGGRNGGKRPHRRH